MCAHAKVEKDQRVFKLVPLVKRNLETMLFKVKALTEAMGCLAAFSLGNLKHRNLQGQEVCSQVVDEDEDDNSENEEGSDAPTPGRVHKQEEGGSGNDCEDTDSEEAASSHSD
jgi:Fanconi anemia group D2 protein